MIRTLSSTGQEDDEATERVEQPLGRPLQRGGHEVGRPDQHEVSATLFGGASRRQDVGDA
jgi:hypothetical protein